MAQYVRIGLFAIQVNNGDCFWIRTRRFLLSFNKLIVFLYVLFTGVKMKMTFSIRLNKIFYNCAM